MTLQASGQMGIDQVNTEFGLTSTNQLSFGTIRTNLGLSGALVMATNLYGVSTVKSTGIQANLTVQTYNNTGVTGVVNIVTNGNTTVTTNPVASADIVVTSSNAVAWSKAVGGTPGNAYFVKYTVTSGLTPTGITPGTVYDLTTNRFWSLTVSSANPSKTSNGDLFFYSDAAGTQQVGTGTWSLTLNVSASAPP